MNVIHYRNFDVFEMRGTGTSVVDTHHFYADPDPAFHFDAAPDRSFHCVAEPDPNPTFQFAADPDPTPPIHFFQIWTLKCSKMTL
jgi:hypothetical protein